MDAAGRLTQDSTGCQIHYTPFDLPRIVSKGGKEVTFAYDAFGRRVLKTEAEGGVVTKTVTLGGLYERRERVEGGAIAVQHVYYVHGDEGPVAQFV